MPNVIAIVQDDRLRHQIEQLLENLEMDDLRVATFKTNLEFQNLYFRDSSNDPPAEEPNEGEKTGEDTIEEGADLKLFSEVHALIFAMDTIGEKPGPWLDKVKFNFKQFKHWPESGAPQTILLKYEDDGVSKLDVMHPLLTDLIFLPLDRLVFLQKMQIFLSLPKSATPRFLFSQEVKHEIEISKIAKVDRLNDVALAIRNPFPLRKGLPGHFYIQLPGEKDRLEIRGKVLRSEPHPEFPGQHLVYFSYFGLSKASLSQIRRTLSKAPRYQSLLKDRREDFRYDPDALFNDTANSPNFGIAIVDSDNEAGHNLSQQLAKEMDRLDIVTESSYQLFLHKYFDSKSSSQEQTPPKATEATDFYNSPISLSVTADLKCLSVDPGPTSEDKILGHPAETLFSSPEGWLRLVHDKESNLLLQEAVELAIKGRVTQQLLSVRDAEGQTRAVNFKFYRGETEQIVTVELAPGSIDEIAVRLNVAAPSIKINFAVLDANFVPDDPSSWIEGLRNRSVQVGLCDTLDQLKFFVLIENESKPNMNWLNAPAIMGLFHKPADSRQMLFLLSELLPNPHTMYQFGNLGWSQPSLSVHVSKNIGLESISEFGATLRSQQQVAPGTIFFLRKSIFDHAPNQCLAARVYSCEEHPNEKGFFQIRTTYFGINDAFLKFARTWIRENYASSKKSE